MTLASCKNNAAWVSMTWDETVAYDRWRVASYTVENRLSYIVPFHLDIAGADPVGSGIPSNTTPPVTNVVPNNYKVHPDEITVLLVC